MKKIIYILIVASLTSCGFLEQSPMDSVVSDNYYNTQEELETALRGVYSTFTETALYANNMLGRLGLSADIGYEQYSSDEGTVGYYEVVPTDIKITNYWRKLYEGIGRANKLLENINKPEMDEKARDVIKGEALFLRGYFHFMLTVRFGDVPIVLSVPKSGHAEDTHIAKSPSREVYRQIIADMEAAAPLVLSASEVTYGTRVTQSAVYGVLARVCLNMAGYPIYATEMYAKVREYASQVIDSGLHSLNPSYQDVFMNYIQDKYDIRESILEVDFYGNNLGTYTNTAGMVGRNNGIAFSNTDMPEIGYSIGTIRATGYYLSLFEDADLRRDWSIANYTLNSNGEKEDVGTNQWIRFCGKFRREYELTSPKSATYTPINFPLLRYSDVLLMYSEGVAADASCNDAALVAQAYEYMNMVRRRGYGKDVFASDVSVDFVNEGKSILFDYIKDERARELGHELLRKDDIVRWGEFYYRMKYVGSLIPQSYTSNYYVTARLVYGNVRERDEFWPIPSYELGINRKLTQNPGW